MPLRELIVSIDFKTNFKTLEIVDNKVSELTTDLGKMGGVGDKAFSDISKSTVGTTKNMTALGRTSQNAISDVNRSVNSVSGSLQSVSRNVDTLGNRVSQNVDRMIGNFDKFGGRVEKVGKKMSTHITTPITAAVGAVTTLTGALGFGRLVAMDTAQAKLRGLGYEGEQVTQIMKDVRSAVLGTTFTTAEGVDVAAGALAAGVSQGAELERYIRLVGSAAAGSNAPMSEMADIFNRIQASGRLMTDELNMINHRMPGFSLAMAEHLGVTSQELSSMVTAGKVSSAQFLDVMESFAGGMSEAMADTWTGLTKNILSNIGAIGESILEGLFIDGKEGLREFLQVLRSDELKVWAKDLGQDLRLLANNVVGWLRDMKSFWDGLSPPIQNAIKYTALFGGIAAVTFGPMLLIAGKVMGSIVQLSKGFGMFRTFMSAKFIPVIARVMTGFSSFIPTITRLIPTVMTIIPAISAASKAFFGFSATLLANPITWVVGAIVGLIAVIWLLWRNWDTVSQWLSDSWNWLKETSTAIFTAIGEWVIGVFSSMTDWIVTKWNEAKEWTSTTLSNMWNTVVGIFTGIYNSISEWMANAYNKIVEVWNNAVSFLQGINLFDVGRDIIQGLINGISSMAEAAWESVKSVGKGIVTAITGLFRTASPSRLTMEIGKDIGAGLQIGIENSAIKVAREAQKLAEAANPTNHIPFNHLPSYTSPITRFKETVTNNERVVKEYYTPERDSGGVLRGNTVVYNSFSPQTTIHVSGNMTREQEREVEMEWRRKIKRWYEEFNREIRMREV